MGGRNSVEFEVATCKPAVARRLPGCSGLAAEAGTPASVNGGGEYRVAFNRRDIAVSARLTGAMSLTGRLRRRLS